MLKNRNLSIAKIINSDSGSEYEFATVIATGNKTVDIKMMNGGVFRRVPISGSASIGDQVQVLFLKGKPTVVSGVSGGGEGGSQVIINTGDTQAQPSNYAPTPHDVFGQHHSWPADPANRFLATTGVSGSPAFRLLALSDIQSVADTRYVQLTRQIIAGNGLSGTSSLASDVTLNIGSGNGIQVLSDSIAVDLASPSGLEFSGGKLQINDLVAGDGIAVANKVFSVPTATTIANGAPAFQGLQTEANGLRLYASHDPGASSHLLASDGTGKLTLPLFRASTNFSSPLYISENGEGLTVRSGTSISLDPGNNQVLLLANKVLQSDGYASQTTGMRITHSGEGDFRYLYSDELHAKSFIADLEQALAGGQIITKSVAVLAADFTLPSAGISNTFVINDFPSAAGMRAFEDGDFVGFRQFDRGSGGLRIAWAWGQVTGYTNLNNGTQQWTFTRSASSPGIASGQIKKDALVLDFGKTGNGYYEVNAIDGLQGANSPYAQIATWATSPSNRTVRTRFGNLRGIFGVSGNSVYTLTISNATGGNFVLWVGEENTGNVAFNASAADLQTAIRTISGLLAATVTGTAGSYTITIPSTAAGRNLFLDDSGLTGGSNLSTNLVLSSQTNEEYGLYAGNGSGVTNRYVRASNTDVELRNVPLRLYDGTNETAQISAGSGNNKPFFAMGSPLPTGPLSNDNGIWMGADGSSPYTYKFRVGSVSGGSLSQGILWDGSSLAVKGAIEVTATSTVGAQIGIIPGQDPYIGIGNTTYLTSVLQNGNGIWMGESGGVAQIRIGSVVSGALSAGVHWNGSTLNVRGAITALSGRIEGVLDIGTTGGIYQGTGSFASPTTGLKIWNESSVGRIAGYNNGTLQWYAGTDGKLYAGGGTVKIDNSGISMVSVNSTTIDGISSYKFTASSGTTSAGLYSRESGSIRSVSLVNNGSGATVSHTYELRAECTGDFVVSAFNAWVPNLQVGTSDGSGLPGGQIRTQSNATIGGGLNVGSASGATTGQILASGQISSKGWMWVRNTSNTTGIYGDSRSAVVLTATDAEAWFIGPVGNATRASTDSALQFYSWHTNSSPLILDHSVAGHRIRLSGQLVAGTVPDGWTSAGVVFGSGWQNYDPGEATWAEFKYKKFGDIIMLRGLVRRASGTGSTVLTLPDNNLFIRPGRLLLIACMSSGGITRVDISAAGVVTVVGPPGTLDWLSFFGVVYSSVA